MVSKRDLGSLFQRHARELHVYINGQVRCAHTAADIVQDVFLRLTQQPCGVAAENPRAYLYRMAGNLAIDHFRQVKRREAGRTSVAELNEVVDEAPTLERRFEASERLQILAHAMAELPALTQQVFRLNRVDGLTHAQVAQRLGICDSSVQKHLSRALRHAIAAVRASGSY